MNKKFFGVLVIGGLLIASYVQAERKQAAEASDTATKQTVTRKTSVTKTTKAVSKSAQEPAAEAQKARERGNPAASLFLLHGDESGQCGLFGASAFLFAAGGGATGKC